MNLKTLMLVSLLLIGLNPELSGNERVVFSFDSPDSAKSWSAVNDGVMGGRSSGRFRLNDDKKLEFTGNLSLQNNGGFASIRATSKNLAMSKGDLIVFRVRGDGRKYNFNLYAQRNLGGYSYRQSFQTKAGQWIEVEMPVDDFVATWRGRTFRDQKLDPSRVTGLGILLGDKKPGPFKLEIDWIKIRSKSQD